MAKKKKPTESAKLRRERYFLDRRQKAAHREDAESKQLYELWMRAEALAKSLWEFNWRVNRFRPYQHYTAAPGVHGQHRRRRVRVAAAEWVLRRQTHVVERVVGSTVAVIVCRRFAIAGGRKHGAHALAEGTVAARLNTSLAAA